MTGKEEGYGEQKRAEQDFDGDHRSGDGSCLRPDRNISVYRI